MSAIASISNTEKTNYLNIGLMLISCVVAFFVPFELFLFSYAVLGPLHYLTEISWLHERNYFSKGKNDYIFLGIAGILLFALIYVVPYLHVAANKPLIDPTTASGMTTGLVYIAFISSLAMVLLKKTFHRFIAFVLICITVGFSQSPGAILLFSVFLPTLIHVFLFTFLFMLFGALKARSVSGYISCIVLLLCPILFIYFTPTGLPISNYASKAYSFFDTVNTKMLELFNPELFVKNFENYAAYRKYIHEIVFESKAGLIIMRFIAFAYTYHYLNWFSKTTVIKWHKVPKKRLIIIGVLWVASVVFYAINYRLGFDVLFLLSFLHVFLEFPLNHITIIGIFKEFGSMFSGKPSPIPVKGNSKGKKN